MEAEGRNGPVSVPQGGARFSVKVWWHWGDALSGW